MKSETGPHSQGQGETKEKADLSRLVGSKLNKQGNLHMRLVLGGNKMSRFLQPLCQILKILYRGLKRVQLLIQFRWSQHHSILLRICP